MAPSFHFQATKFSSFLLGVPVGVKPRDLRTGPDLRKKFNPKHISHLQERWEIFLWKKSVCYPWNKKNSYANMRLLKAKGGWMNQKKHLEGRHFILAHQNSGFFSAFPRYDMNIPNLEMFLHTWRIIPVSKWLITMVIVIVSPPRIRFFPFQMALSWLIKWGWS